MAKSVKFVLNRAGVRELMKSDEMEAVCQEYADRALQQLGDGYTTSAFKGRNRVNVEIAAESIKAKRQNSKHNSILKALGGG